MPSRFNHLERFILVESGCWHWTGPVDRAGYGRGPHGKLAHRIFYQNFKGPIPKGLFACHTCDNPICVNPAHLWLGTPKDNMHDASRKKRHRGQSQNKCKNGHEYTPENTYIRPNSFSARDCRICIAQRVAKYKRAKAA